MEARIERVASPGDADSPEANAWIVGDDDEVIVVDPGRDAGAVLAAVGDREILAVICTQGHSPGSACLYSEELEAVFVGDVLTASGPVPHDGEYPDFPAQLSAIGEHLLTLPGPTRVLPGHGEETTVSAAQKKFD